MPLGRLRTFRPPKVIGTTTVVSVGHKGRYVGVIGLFQKPDNKGYFLKYQLVSMGEEYETPSNPETIAKHPVMNLWEEYAKEVEKEKYIERFAAHIHFRLS